MDQTANKILVSILTYMEGHNNQGYKKTDIDVDTLIIDVFPTENFEDEQANRFGICLTDLMRWFEVDFGVDMPLDYEVRTEFELFKTVRDVFLYFYGRVTGLDKAYEEIDIDLDSYIEDEKK